MRIVVFTGFDDIEGMPWWRVIAATPGLEAVLICRQLPKPSAGGARRFWRNVRKHGALWIPYRVGHALVSIAGRAFVSGARHAAEPEAVAFPVERVAVASLASDEAIAHVRAFAPDLGVALGAPILKPQLFTIPLRGTLNTHEGAVPEYRGAPPGFWELHFGATEVGATAHWVDASLDTGHILAEARAPLYAADTLRDVQARTGELGLRVLGQALALIAAGGAPGAAQSAAGRTNRQPLLAQRFALWRRFAMKRLRRRLTPRAIAKTLAGLVALWVYRPARNAVRTLTATHPLHVFNFHRVTDLCRDGMTVSPQMLDRQAEYLRRTHDVVTLDQALALVREGRRLRRPAALLTFDDGYRSVYEQARPILARYGLVGCSFVSTDLVGTDRRLPHDDANPVRALLDVMTWPEVIALRAAGWSIGSHSASHARLAACQGEELGREVDGSRKALIAKLGAGAFTIAYPYGGRADISPEARARIRAAGYAACFNDLFGETRLPGAPFDINRIELGGDHTTLAWKLFAHGISLEKFRG